MILLRLLPLLLLLGAATAHAQHTLVYQSGGALADTLMKGISPGRIGTAGNLSGDALGRGVNPFMVQDGLGLGLCSSTAAAGAARNVLCFGHDASGNGLVTLDSYAGYANKPLNFRINGVTIPFTTAVSMYVDPRQFGADSTGATDSTAAIQLAFDSLAGNGGTVVFAPGIYTLTGPITTSITAADAKLSILGPGATLKWTAAGGLAITVAVPSSTNTNCYKGAIDVSGLKLVTMVPGGGTALAVNVTSSCGNASGAPVSTIDVSAHGDYETSYWTKGIELTKLSNVNITGDVRGRAALGMGLGPAGIGVSVIGTVTQHSVGFNLRGMNFEGLAKGVLMGDYTEGLTITGGSNFTSISPGCGVEVNGAATLQLMVTNSQFGLSSGHICILSDFVDLNIANNLFITFGGNKLIHLGPFAIEATLIANNQFLSADANPSNGILADNTSGTTVLTGNYFQMIGTGLKITAATARFDLRANNNIGAPANQPKLVENTGVTPYLMMPDVIDVRAFGAICDNSANDAGPFLAATLTAGVNSIGVYGTCRISADTTLSRPLYIAPTGTVNLDGGVTLTTTGITADTYVPFVGAGVATEGAQLVFGTGAAARKVFYGPDLRMPALPGSAGAGGVFLCIDNANQIYKKATCP
jgi:hypothetical protein